MIVNVCVSTLDIPGMLPSASRNAFSGENSCRTGTGTGTGAIYLVSSYRSDRGNIAYLRFPVSINSCVECDDDFEVMAAAADYPLHLLHTLDCINLGLCLDKQRLRRSERGLVVVRRPLATPFARHGVEVDAFHNRRHDTHGRLVVRGRR